MTTHETQIKNVILQQFPTESALARELGWPRQRLNRITTGNRLPTIEEVNALSKVLRLSVDTLVHIFLPD